MPHRSLIVRVGELFAEVCDSKLSNTLWFLPKKPLADALKEKIKISDYDEIHFQLLMRPDALPTDRFDERKIAAVVTSGFEGVFGKALEEKDLFRSNDLIFGISERIDSKGRIAAKISKEDCDLICQKLKLMNVTQILIGSVHSNLNSENQNSLATYFRDQGFTVYISDSKISGELTRWSELIEKAQWAHLIEDLSEQLGEIKKSVKVKFETLPELKFLKPTFFAGLDIFFVGDSSTRPVILDSQPSDIIEPGFFDAPEFRHFKSMYRNGPLLIGKSLRPTALDLFLLEDREFQVKGLVPAQFERMKSRIEESLVVMSKAQQSVAARIDGAKVANDTLNIFVTALASELKNLQAANFKVEGPLTELVIKHLKQVDPSAGVNR